MLGRKFILLGLASCLASSLVTDALAKAPANPKPGKAQVSKVAAKPVTKKVKLGKTAKLVTPLAAVSTAKFAVATPATRLPAVVSDSGPEAQLVTIFKEIEANRLGNALQLTDALLSQHPNYRLASLIKGGSVTRPAAGHSDLWGDDRRPTRQGGRSACRSDCSPARLS